MRNGSDEIEFSAAFRRFTPELTAELRRIDSALALVGSADILPAAADQLRSAARVGTIHFSTLIEGNELPVLEAERAARGELAPETKAKIELINYVEALDLLDERLASDGLAITPELILEIHGATTRGLGEKDGRFKPHHEGAWRDGIARVFNHFTQTFTHEGPPALEVPGRMAGLCAWIERSERRPDEYPPPVLAGVAHHAIADVHPFADGNGRVARLLAVAILMRHDYMPGRLFSIERYYAEDRDAYYRALQSVRARTLNLEEWLRYYLYGLVLEYERVAAKIAELRGLGIQPLARTQLKPSQERGLSKLAVDGLTEFRRVDYERASGLGKTQAMEDLRRLVEAGVLVPRGRGSASRYRFRNAPHGQSFAWGQGRRRTWTDERIETELREFCRGRDRWPAVKEFEQAGLRPLYLALSRHGGTTHWARVIGLEKG